MEEFNIPVSGETRRSLAEIRQEMKAIRDEMASATDKERWTELAGELGSLKNEMKDLNDQAAIFATGSDFEKVNNSVKTLGKGIGSLDFGKAKDGAAALDATIKGLSPETISTAFKDLTGIVKSLGSTFLTLGKQLLMNPLFLLAAVIVGLVVVIVKLLDKIGVLKIITEAIGKVFKFFGDIIDSVVESLKRLTDWLGWTNNAAKDNANVQADSAERISDAYNKMGKIVTQELDNEIRMMKLNGENTEELERKKLKALALVTQKELEAAQAKLRAAQLSGDLDEKEMQALKDKVFELQLSYKQRLSDTQYFEAQILKAKEDALEKDREMNEKAEADRLKASHDAFKTRQKALQKFAEEDLAILRRFEDLEINLIEDVTEKAIAQSEIRQKREIQDLEKNQEARLKALREAGVAGKALREAEAKLFEETEALKTQIILNAELERSKIIEDNLKVDLDMRQRDLQAQLQLEETANDEKKRILEELKQLEIANTELTENEKLLIIQNYNDQIRAIDEADLLYQQDKRAHELQALLNLQETTLEEKLLYLEELMMMDLEFEELTEAERMLIKQRYHEMALDLIEEEKQANIDAAQATIETAQAALNSVQALSDAVFANKMKNLEKGSAEELKAAKKQFETNKKIQIAAATISGIQGVINALTAVSVVPEPAGSILKAANAVLVGISSAANIAKIRATRFEGGGSVPTSVPTPASVPAAAPSAPSFTLFGTGGQANNASAAQASETQTNVTVTAVVSETEITSTQERVKKYAENAEL